MVSSANRCGYRAWRCVVGLAILCASLSACGDEQSDQKGSTAMFGLFGKKAVKVGTDVAGQVGATLQRRDAFPALPPPVVPAFPECQVAHMRGDPPDAKWVPEKITGETRSVFRIPAGRGHVPLAVFAKRDAEFVEVWELSDDKLARFIKQRDVALDPAQASWTLAYPQAVACLPGQLAAVAIGYHDPAKKDALFIYNTSSNQFRRVDLINPDTSRGPPFVPFDILAATPEAMLVLYHTSPIFLGMDNSVYQYDHVLLFSPRHPQGLEIIKLAIDDGNVTSWGMQGRTLWLNAVDRRKQPKEFTWSLDLDKVL
jgi:hypothetical protein